MMIFAQVVALGIMVLSAASGFIFAARTPEVE